MVNMVTGARQAGLRVSQTDGLLGFAHHKHREDL